MTKKEAYKQLDDTVAKILSQTNSKHWYNIFNDLHKVTKTIKK